MDSAITRTERAAHTAPAPSSAPGPGTLVAGKYRLESLLGEGGIGTVWRARNETLDAPVALKLIRSGMQREETVARLLREAHVEARLKHPNIVRVFDLGLIELGDAFVVMELLEGINLGELLEDRGRLGDVEAVQLMLPVIWALCHAHEHGVVHRALEPRNIFLDRGGLHAGTKLLDFGVAKLAGELDRRFAPDGRLLGSPAYMAPEQAEGSEDVDHRADIWAICVVLYEAISGAPAFAGERSAALRKVVENELPPLEGGGPGHARLWQVLSRGLSKDPARRQQSMRELGAALAQWLCDQGESEDLDGNRLSRRWNVTAVGDAALAAPPRRPRIGTTKRMVAGAALAIALLALTPSKLGEHAALAVAAGPQTMSARAELVRLAAPTAASATAASAPPIAAGTQPASADSSPPRRSRRLSERDLGLKVPY